MEMRMEMRRRRRRRIQSRQTRFFHDLRVQRRNLYLADAARTRAKSSVTRRVLARLMKTLLSVSEVDMKGFWASSGVHVPSTTGY